MLINPPTSIERQSHKLTMEYTLFISVFLLLMSSSSSFTPAPPAPTDPCNTDDAKALLAIKSSLNVYTNWNQSNDCCDGSWHGVRCDPSGRVTSLVIMEKTVSGQIPPQVGDIPYLTSLAMYKLTGLTGPIPYSFTKLKQLTSLWLESNSLSGPVPAFLSQLTKLNLLNLASNQFTGSIPASLGSLPLTFLQIDRNKLSGPIPRSLGRIPSLYLYLSRNELSGHIPKSFANGLFAFMDLSHNKLAGDASFLFRPSSPLQQLDLSINMLEFDLTNVMLPNNLHLLDLSNNKIYGSIPSEFMARDWEFNVSYNMLCGVIPASEIPGQNSDPTAFFHNRCLCGPPLSPCQ